jgi:hypothetical protein
VAVRLSTDQGRTAGCCATRNEEIYSISKYFSNSPLLSQRVVSQSYLNKHPVRGWYQICTKKAICAKHGSHMACPLARAHVLLLFCWLLFFTFRRFQCHACKKLESGSGSIFFCGSRPFGEVISARGCSQLWPWLTTTSLARPCLPRRARCFSRRALQGSAAPFWGECQPACCACVSPSNLQCGFFILFWLVHAAAMQAAPQT